MKRYKFYHRTTNPAADTGAAGAGAAAAAVAVLLSTDPVGTIKDREERENDDKGRDLIPR